ncbi:MAG: SMC-Scp complex subunit ScpB [Rhodospirillales bacterium]|nr:SMC-Scp complex subunit ScpB [Rhodospirillales bacterium]
MSELDPQHLRLLEAILFASQELMNEKSLATRLPEEADIEALLAELEKQYADRGVNLVNVGKGWAFRTAPDLARQLSIETEVSRKLSRAAIETMAIMAYHQPVTRAEIEEVRGVSLSKGTLDVLFEAGWIKPRGRRKTPGRPMAWGTTDAFLDHFGLESIKDLPGMEDLKAAGLLDARPALNAYAARGEMMGTGELFDANDVSEVEEVAVQELEAELSEPLDPDDGVSP